MSLPWGYLSLFIVSNVTTKYEKIWKSKISYENLWHKILLVNDVHVIL